MDNKKKYSISDMPEDTQVYMKLFCIAANVDPETIDFGADGWQEKGSWTEEQKNEFVQDLARILEESSECKKGEGLTSAKDFVKHCGWVIKK